MEFDPVGLHTSMDLVSSFAERVLRAGMCIYYVN